MKTIRAFVVIMVLVVTGRAGSASAQALTTLFTFNGTNGSAPNIMLKGLDGNFYGTTLTGGVYNLGTIFQLTPKGSLTTLHSFTGGADGYSPNYFAQANDTNFYGTTYNGGTNNCTFTTDCHGGSCGTIFQISPAGDFSSFEFSGGSLGGFPISFFFASADDCFFGSTQSGGTGGLRCGPDCGCGELFYFCGSGQIQTPYGFGSESLQSQPYCQVNVMDSQGNLYGTTANNGGGEHASVFMLAPSDAYTNLWTFYDGSGPQLVFQGSDSNFYGTVLGGPACLGCGSIFQLTPQGTLTNLYTFGEGADGGWPALAFQGSDGNFYGTAVGGSTNSVSGYGSIFQLTPRGTLTTLYKFSGGADGGWPVLSFQGNDGNLYGVTGTGGTSTNCEGGCGTVFMFSLVGTPCSYTLSATNATFASAGGSGSVSVSASNGCAWTATSNVSWITITSGGSGSGDGTVQFSVAANTSTKLSQGTMTIAGQTFTVTQSGSTPCTYTLSATAALYSSSGGNGSVNVTAGSSCTWTGTSNNGFVTITSGGSGSGDGTVQYSVAANTSTNALTGTMTIAGQTFTVTQSASGNTPAVYQILSSAKLSVGGLGNDISVILATNTLSDAGTFDLLDGQYDYTGTYALVKHGKQMVFALDANGLSTIESMLRNWIQSLAAEDGVSLDDLSLSVQRVTISNAAMQDGVPNKAKITVSGKVNAVVNGTFKTKSFTYNCVLSYWALISGANP